MTGRHARSSDLTVGNQKRKTMFAVDCTDPLLRATEEAESTSKSSLALTRFERGR